LSLPGFQAYQWVCDIPNN